MSDCNVTDTQSDETVTGMNSSLQVMPAAESSDSPFMPVAESTVISCSQSQDTQMLSQEPTSPVEGVGLLAEDRYADDGEKPIQVTVPGDDDNTPVTRGADEQPVTAMEVDLASSNNQQMDTETGDTQPEDDGRNVPEDDGDELERTEPVQENMARSIDERMMDTEPEEPQEHVGVVESADEEHVTVPEEHVGVVESADEEHVTVPEEHVGVVESADDQHMDTESRSPLPSAGSLYLLSTTIIIVMLHYAGGDKLSPGRRFT